MVKPISSDKKGIYIDLYRTLEAERDEKYPERKRKGIYANLYRQFEEDKKNVSLYWTGEKKEKISPLIVFKNAFNRTVSKMSSFSSYAAGEFKILMLACMVAKKPINNYIESRLPVYQIQEKQGFYYNE